MTAGHVLRIYQVRKSGYEEGLLQYPASLYAGVCTLVDALAALPSDEEIRLNLDVGYATFVVAKTGRVLATLPIGEVRNDLGEGAR
jgi:hypothetical protein